MATIEPTRAGRRNTGIVSTLTIARRVERLGEVQTDKHGDVKTRICDVCVQEWTPAIGPGNTSSDYCPDCRMAGRSRHCGSMRGVNTHQRVRAPLCPACIAARAQHHADTREGPRT